MYRLVMLVRIVFATMKTLMMTNMLEEAGMDWQCPIFGGLCAAEYYGCGWFVEEELEGGGRFLSCFLGFPDEQRVKQYQEMDEVSKQKIWDKAVEKRTGKDVSC